MKPKASLFFLFLILTGYTVVSAAEQPKKFLISLTQDGVNAQRQAVRDAQNRVLKELDGTKYQVFGMAITIAGMTLNVGADALTVLHKSALVSDVTESGSGIHR